MALLHLQYGALRLHVEPPDGLHLVAKQVDPHGLARFRRKHVQNSAPDRILAHHFHRLPALIPDALQVRNHFFQREFLTHAQAQREVLVVLAGLDLQQRRRHRQDGDGNLLGGQPPQPDSALLQDFRMRREILQRRHVQRRQKLRTAAAAILRRQQIEEGGDGFEQRLRLLVSVNYYNDWISGELPQQDRIERLSGKGQARDGRLPSGGKPAQRLLKAGMLSQLQKQVSNSGVNQGWSDFSVAVDILRP